MAQIYVLATVSIKDENQNQLKSGDYKAILLIFNSPGLRQIGVTSSLGSFSGNYENQIFQIVFSNQGSTEVWGSPHGTQTKWKVVSKVDGKPITITIKDATGSNSVEEIQVLPQDGTNWDKITLQNNPSQVVISINLPIVITIPTEEGEVDSNGIIWFLPQVKGKQATVVKQSRDEPDDDRWSENVDGCENGFEQTMIAKSIGIASDGHFASKLGGSNHSGGSASKQRWMDLGVRANGDIQLQWEGPHPTNHDFDLPDSKLFIKNIGKKLEGNWVGLKWAQEILKPGGSPADGGVRWRMWVNTDIANDGKPDNTKWKLALDFIDGVDVQVIQPQDFKMTGTMDVEVRRSGTKTHEVYGGGLLIRPFI